MKWYDWYYCVVFKKYSEFNGRARRKEYWYFILFNILIVIALYGLDVHFGTTLQDFATANSPGAVNSHNPSLGLISIIYCILVLIPGLAVQVRRLHDIGRTGWWILINLIPIIGPLVMLIFMVLPSDLGSNKYGPNPIAEQD